jgi:hypothetical protein
MKSVCCLFFILGNNQVNKSQLKWWLHNFLYNYDHFIKQQLYQLWKALSSHCLSLQIVLLPCLCPRDGPSPEEWHIAFSSWFIADVCYFMNLVSVGIYCYELNVTNWSSLEVVYVLLYELIYKQTFNTLIWIELI